MLDQIAVASVIMNILIGVVGPDTRTQILDANLPDYQGVGQIMSCLPDGTCQASCTGTLIGPSTLITAAHCARKIFRPLEKCGHPHTTVGLRKSFYFIQGRVGKNYNETQKFQIVDRVSFFDCYGSPKTSGDVALMRLDRNSNLGHVELVPSEVDQTFRRIRIAGYPGEKDEGTLWRTESRVKKFMPITNTLGKVVYSADTSGGMSGSLVWGQIGRDWVPVGVHRGSDNDSENWATRLSSDLVRAVRKRSTDWTY